jgi:hypothetical protein
MDIVVTIILKISPPEIMPGHGKLWEKLLRSHGDPGEASVYCYRLIDKPGQWLLTGKERLGNKIYFLYYSSFLLVLLF